MPGTAGLGGLRGDELIHGELGPDHVLIDERGHPVIIDIEGVMFFDLAARTKAPDGRRRA